MKSIHPPVRIRALTADDIPACVALVTAVFRDASIDQLGLRQAKIETLDTNLAGQHLYPKLGFVEVARQIHYAMPL